MKKIKKVGKAEKGSIVLKSYAVLCSLILTIAIISFSFSLAPVKAQGEIRGCCIKTKDIPPAYCQENVKESDCGEEYFYTGRDCSSLPGGVSDYCKKGTCKPSTSGDQCQVNKPKFECTDIGGEWNPASDKNNFPNGWCQEGCCDIHGKVPCEIKEKKICKDIAEDYGFEFTDDMFITGLDEGQCKEKCAGADRGCCVRTAGCEYSTREACGIGIPFQKDVYCSDVDICGIKNASYEKRCGGPDDGGLGGDEHKIYYYNEKGTRELLVINCGYPAFICEYCEDDECNDQLTQEIVKEDEPYCKSTTCSFELKDKDSEGRSGKQSLLSGQRMCYNFHKDEHGRTTGLQHYVLTCERGEVIPDALGIEREDTLCKGKGEEFKNEYAKCTNCGEGGLWSAIGDHWQNTPLIGDLLGGVLAKPCEGLWSFWGVDKCKDFGDCRYNTDVIKKPLGSCIPIYTPGTKGTDDYKACELCGKSGDGASNYCDEEECNALGDCRFERYKLGRLKQIGSNYLIILATSGLATIITCAFSIGYFWQCLRARVLDSGRVTQSWWKVILNMLKPKITLPLKVPKLTEAKTVQLSPDKVSVIYKPGEEQVEMKMKQISLLIPAVLYSVVMGLAGREAGYCLPEDPKDHNMCEYCGGKNNSYRKCTKERCQILGNCEAVPKDETGEEEGQDYVCLERECEGERPAIEEMGAEWYVGDTKVGEEVSESVRVEGKNIQIINKSELLPWNVSELYLEVDTNIGAKCRYAIDEAGQKWDNMFDFEENRLFPDWQYALVPIFGYGREHYVYVKCRDICENEHSAAWDYNYVYFKLDEKPDDLPPDMTKIDPLNVYIDESIPSIDVKVWLDENGKCRYSKDLDNTNFATMSDFICEQDQKCFGIDTYNCAHCKLSVDLTAEGEEIDWQAMPEEFSEAFKEEGIYNSTSFRYVFVCQDDKANTGEPFNYTLVTVPGYDMNIVKPEPGEEIYVRTRDLVIEVNASRKTDCRYSIDDANKLWEELTLITDHMTRHHSGTINESLKATQSGFKHTLYVTCKDFADIVRTGNVEFKAMMDVTPPKIIRAYYEEDIEDLLTIITDEESTCVYSIENCDYDFEKGIAMPPEFAKEHSANWNSAWTYHIKCKDAEGSVPPSGRCTMIVHPYSVV